MSTPDLSAIVWRTSSRSNGGGGQCVEIALVPAFTAVRDSKNPVAGTLIFPQRQWATFRDQARSGLFDLA